MTFKQLMFRYLKENGYYNIFIKCCKTEELNMCNSPIIFIGYVDMILSNNNIYWKYGESFSSFIYELCFPKNLIKHGDTVKVRTIEGKYVYDVRVLYVDYDFFRFYTSKHSMIDIGRIIEINGVPVDFVNGWKFKKGFME